MPADRFLHPRLGRDERVTQLTDFDARVLFTGVYLCADDYGVMRCSALPLQEANDALAKRPAITVERSLGRIIDAGLLLKFVHQGRPYVCVPDWQDGQKIKYPRATLNPVPPAEILACCSDDTQELFRSRGEKRSEATSHNSRNVSETLSEHSENTSETFPNLARAGAREEANGYRLEATGKRLTAANGNGTGLRERFDAFWKVYPKKVGKDAAWRAWEKCQPSAQLTEQICAAIAWQRQQDSWLQEAGRFVPNPATWINRGQWQDEPSTAPRISDRTLADARAVEGFVNDRR